MIQNDTLKAKKALEEALSVDKSFNFTYENLVPLPTLPTPSLLSGTSRNLAHQTIPDLNTPLSMTAESPAAQTQPTLSSTNVYPMNVDNIARLLENLVKPSPEPAYSVETNANSLVTHEVSFNHFGVNQIGFPAASTGFIVSSGNTHQGMAASEEVSRQAHIGGFDPFFTNSSSPVAVANNVANFVTTDPETPVSVQNSVTNVSNAALKNPVSMDNSVTKFPTTDPENNGSLMIQDGMAKASMNNWNQYQMGVATSLESWLLNDAADAGATAAQGQNDTMMSIDEFCGTSGHGFSKFL